jgi:hypothetical protein
MLDVTLQKGLFWGHSLRYLRECSRLHLRPLTAIVEKPWGFTHSESHDLPISDVWKNDVLDKKYISWKIQRHLHFRIVIWATYICHVLGKNDEKSFAILDDIGWQLNGNCSPIAAGMGMTLLSRNWPCTIFCCVWQPKKWSQCSKSEVSPKKYTLW